MDRLAYVEWIGRALDWIERNLGAPIALEDLAREACFSPYHFHRIFVAHVGETPAAYIRKRRLTEAARALLDPARRIVDVALDAGFDSQEAFTRAFKQFHGVTPGEHRRRGVPSPVRQPALTRETIEHLRRNVTMEPKFVDLAGFAVVGMSAVIDPDGPPDQIPRLWERFVPRMAEVPDAEPGRALGICYPSPRDPGAPAGAPRFEYVAAVPVTRAGEVPPGMEPRTVAARRYAVFTHRGHVSRIKDTVDFIWGSWMPRSGLAPAMAPDFELYDERFDGRTGSGEVDIYVPIEAPPGAQYFGTK